MSDPVAMRETIKALGVEQKKLQGELAEAQAEVKVTKEKIDGLEARLKAALEVKKPAAKPTVVKKRAKSTVVKKK